MSVFVGLHVCLCVRMSGCPRLCACMSAFPSVCLYVCMSVCLYVCMSVRLYNCFSGYLCISCISVYLQFCMSVCPHVCMSFVWEPADGRGYPLFAYPTVWCATAPSQGRVPSPCTAAEPPMGVCLSTRLTAQNPHRFRHRLCTAGTLPQQIAPALRATLALANDSAPGRHSSYP